jgi:hypothetical protein
MGSHHLTTGIHYNIMGFNLARVQVQEPEVEQTIKVEEPEIKTFKKDETSTRQDNFAREKDNLAREKNDLARGITPAREKKVPQMK